MPGRISDEDETVPAHNPASRNRQRLPASPYSVNVACTERHRRTWDGNPQAVVTAFASVGRGAHLAVRRRPQKMACAGNVAQYSMCHVHVHLALLLDPHEVT